MTLLTPPPASKPLLSTSLTSGIVGPGSGANVGLAVNGASLSGEGPNAGNAGDQTRFATELDATLQSLVPPTPALTNGPREPAFQGVGRDLIAPDPLPSVTGVPDSFSAPATLPPIQSETGKSLPFGGADLPLESKSGAAVNVRPNQFFDASGPVAAQFSPGFPEPSDVAVPGVTWTAPRAPLEQQGENPAAPAPIALSTSPALETLAATPQHGKVALLPGPKPAVVRAKISITPNARDVATPVSPAPTAIAAKIAKFAPAPEALPLQVQVAPKQAMHPLRTPTSPTIGNKAEIAPRSESPRVPASPTQDAALKVEPNSDAPGFVAPAVNETSVANATLSFSSSSTPSAPSTVGAGEPTIAKNAVLEARMPNPATPATAKTPPPSSTIATLETPQTDPPVKAVPVSSEAAQEPLIEQGEAVARPAPPANSSEAVAAQGKPPLQAAAALTGASTPKNPTPLPSKPVPKANLESSDAVAQPVATTVPLSVHSSTPKPISLRAASAKVPRPAAPSERATVVQPGRTATAEPLRVASGVEAAAPATLAEGTAPQTAASSPSPTTAPSASPTLPAPATPSVASAPAAANPAPSLTAPTAAPPTPTSAAITASVEQFVEQISEAREAGRAFRPELTVRTGDFGQVGLRIDPSASANLNDWRATLVSRDPSFVPAVQAALAERAVMAASESGLSQSGAFSQRGGDHSPQNSGSQNSASNQSPSGFSAGFHGGGAGQEPRYGSSTGGDQGSAKPYSGEEADNGLDQAAADARDAPSSEGSDGLSSGSGGALFA